MDYILSFWGIPPHDVIKTFGHHFVGTVSDTKCGFSQLTEGIQCSPIYWIWPLMSPSLCEKMVEIGQVVFEI